MTDVLIYGDTYRSSDLRHAVPLGIPDPFLYIERDGVKHLQINASEIPRILNLSDCEAHPYDDFGLDALISKGVPRHDALYEIACRAVRSFGITSAIVPEVFPLRLGDLLRASGVKLHTDRHFFEQRRRVKNQSELEGIRRAQGAAEEAMNSVRDLLRQAKAGTTGLEVDGHPLTSEGIKTRVTHALVAHDAYCPDPIVSHGTQTAIPHHRGEGQLLASEPIVVDLWPRDNASGCFADMTRTFVVGAIPKAIEEWQSAVKDVLDRVVVKVRACVWAGELYSAACDSFESAGYPTLRTKSQDAVVQHGFIHALGHGVGLDPHERPILGPNVQDALQTGEIVTTEPGLYEPRVGGVRLEDLVLVTADGPQTLTNYPYDLRP